MKKIDSKSILSPSIAVIFSIIYTFIMGIGMYIMHNYMNSFYGNPTMMYTMLWAEILLTILCIYVVKKYSNWESIGFGKLNKKNILWILPLLLVAIVSAGNFFYDLFFNVQINKEQGILLVFTAITTFLVGFSEEVMFRGILLRSFTNRDKILVGMFVSALLFSLLHAVNIFGGSPGNAVIQQLIFTFIFGLAFAPIALKLNNLWPLIILHFIWDFVLLSHNIIWTPPHYINGYLVNIEIIILVILWGIYIKEYFSKKKNK